jgi:glutathione S-transferase
MRLLLSPTSPFARKVHAVLLEKGLPFETVYLTPADATVSAANPLGKIPALLRDDDSALYDSALYDSAVIVQYLEAIAPTPAVFPADPLARIEVLRWEALCDGVCDATVLRMVEGRRVSEKQEPKWIAHQEGKMRAGLVAIEAELGGRTYAVGGAFSLADIAIVMTVGYITLRAPELLAPHDALVRWAATHAERPSLAMTAPPAA